MPHITVSEEQYCASQEAMVAMLEKEFAIKNQSPSKIKHLVSQVLLYTNSHQLEAVLKSSSPGCNLSEDNALKECRRKINEFAEAMMVDGEPVSSLFICDNCEHIDKHSEMSPAKDLSMRLDDGSEYTDVECPHCGALAYSMSNHIERGLFDGICKSTEPAMIDYAVALSDMHLHNGNKSEQQIADALRSLYFIADGVGKSEFKVRCYEGTVGWLIDTMVKSVQRAVRECLIFDESRECVHDYFSRTMNKELKTIISGAYFDLDCFVDGVMPFLNHNDKG